MRVFSLLSVTLSVLQDNFCSAESLFNFSKMRMVNFGGGKYFFKACAGNIHSKLEASSFATMALELLLMLLPYFNR